MTANLKDWQLTKEGDIWDDGSQWWRASLNNGTLIGHLISMNGNLLYQEDSIYAVICPYYFGDAKGHNVSWSKAVEIFASEVERWNSLGET